MKVTDLEIKGLKLIELKLWHDDRGFFTERFVKSKFEEAGIKNNFIQDNHSHSKAGVVRGLHYQKSPDQAKLVGCIKGRILDVAVDIRKDSPTFGKHYKVELSDKNGLMLLVPAGFAHGFSALTECDVIYKVDGGYNPQGEGGIIYNDKELNIDWGISNNIVSEKDLKLQSFAEYKNNPVF